MASTSNPTENWKNADRGDNSGVTRAARTSKILLDKSKSNYSREMFLPHLKELKVAEALEACGPTAAPYIWLLTFTTVEVKNLFEEAGTFECNGSPARIYDPHYVPNPRLKRVYARMHWVPYHVPMSKAVEELTSNGEIKLIAADYEYCKSPGLEHVRTMIRSLVIEAQDPEKIPSYIKWRLSNGLTGTALLTFKGRLPKCLRCGQSGHTRKNCSTAKCRVCHAFGHDNADCNLTPSWASKVLANVHIPDGMVESELLPDDDDSENATRNTAGDAHPIITDAPTSAFNLAKIPDNGADGASCSSQLQGQTEVTDTANAIDQQTGADSVNAVLGSSTHEPVQGLDVAGDLITGTAGPMSVAPSGGTVPALIAEEAHCGVGEAVGNKATSKKEVTVINPSGAVSTPANGSVQDNLSFLNSSYESVDTLQESAIEVMNHSLNASHLSEKNKSIVSSTPVRKESRKERRKRRRLNASGGSTPSDDVTATLSSNYFLK